MQTDSEDVLVVTETMQRNLWVNMARFRNGDAKSGLAVIKRESRGDFLPWIRDTLLEKAVEHFAEKHSLQRSHLLSNLEQLAVSTREIEAVLILSGYLAWPELAELAWQVWSKLEDAERLTTLPHLVWALTRCADVSAQDKLKAALLLAKEISDEDDSDKLGSKRHWRFVEPLRCLGRWKITASSAKTIAELAATQVDLREVLLTLVRHIDQPVTIEAYIRILEGKGGFFFDFGEPVGPRDKQEFRKSTFDRIPCEPNTRDRLWQIVVEDNNDDIRRMAYRFWSRKLSSKDLERLRSVKKTDVIFDSVLKDRLFLRDAAAADAVIEKLRTDDPAKWCLSAVNLYNDPQVEEAILETFDQTFTKSKFKLYARRLPLYLPPKGVKRLLREHRATLEKDQQCWNALWRTELPEAFAFIKTTLQQCPKLDEFWFRASANVFPYPVSQQMLSFIEPFLDRFSNSDKGELAELAVKSGFATWANMHSLGKQGLGDVQVSLWLTESEATETLDRALNEIPNGELAVWRTVHFHDLVDRGKWRPLMFNLSTVLQGWLGTNPSLSKLIVAGMILVNAGSGEDADWWQQYEPEFQTTEHETWSRVLYFLRRERWQKPKQPQVND